MSFTDAYGSILLPFVENYKTAKNEKARKGVVDTAANTILNSRNLLEEQGSDLPQDLKAVCDILLIYFFSTDDHNFRPSDGTSKHASRNQRTPWRTQ